MPFHYITREVTSLIPKLAKGYPVLAITGPRQSGKTTLAKNTFSDRDYVNLENPSHLEFANNDPIGFLNRYPDGVIIDEVQNCPQLLSYIQERVDNNTQMGKYILTGSQQFEMMSKITQSLAGRVGAIELLPFSINELPLREATDKQMIKGFYPPLYNREVDSRLWIEDYIKTYLERDVRKLLNIINLSQFQTFMKLCAARTGSLLNISELSTATGINAQTVKSWLSVLESSYITFMLKPHFKNFSKRLVKSPKLYFYDTGLLCYLLSIHTQDDLAFNSYRGQVFENMVIADLLKQQKHYRAFQQLYFWRDSKGLEVDVLVENGEKLRPVEIKSGQTFQASWLTNIKKYHQLAKTKLTHPTLVYDGSSTYTRDNINIDLWHTIKL